MSVDEANALLLLISSLGIGTLAVWRYGVNPARAWWQSRRDRNSAVAMIITEIAPLVRDIAKQVLPNGGTSMSDKITKLAQDVVFVKFRGEQAMSVLRMATAKADSTGRLVEVSELLQRQCGRTSTELLGRGWLGCVDEIERTAVRSGFLNSVEDHRAFDAIFAWQRPDGRYCPVKMTSWPDEFGGYMLNFLELDTAVWPRPPGAFVDVDESPEREAEEAADDSEE